MLKPVIVYSPVPYCLIEKLGFFIVGIDGFCWEYNTVQAAKSSHKVHCITYYIYLPYDYLISHCSAH
jgi:hypothetical protein